LTEYKLCVSFVPVTVLITEKFKYVHVVNARVFSVSALQFSRIFFTQTGFAKIPYIHIYDTFVASL